jgi:hypothetical protein
MEETLVAYKKTEEEQKRGNIGRQSAGIENKMIKAD